MAGRRTAGGGAGCRDATNDTRQAAVDARAGQALDELLDVLPQQAAELEPGLPLSRGRSVDTLLRAFAEGNEAELFPGAVVKIGVTVVVQGMQTPPDEG